MLVGMAEWMDSSTEASAVPQQIKPPSDAKIRAVIGESWNCYRSALRGLEALELKPEFYPYSPSGGWALRFQINHVTGCALYLGQALIGLVSIGPRAEAALLGDPAHDVQIARLVLATPRRAKVRWVKMPLRSQADVRRFLSLVEAKIGSRQPSSEKPASHTPRRRTTAVPTGRKKSDTQPRRSTARRNSRG
jgi:Protein of unknown function (DUF3788)